MPVSLAVLGVLAAGLAFVCARGLRFSDPDPVRPAAIAVQEPGWPAPKALPAPQPSTQEPRPAGEPQLDGLAAPEQGRNALYIASHAYAIEGMERAAAQKLLAELIDAATAPGLSYVHTWRSGDRSREVARAHFVQQRPRPTKRIKPFPRETTAARAATRHGGTHTPLRFSPIWSAPRDLALRTGSQFGKW